MEAGMKVEVPFPISVNAMYRNPHGGGKRHKTQRYLTWRNAAGWSLKGARPILGPVAVSIALGAPDNRHRGADNYIKAVLDLLVEHGLIENDEGAVRGISVYWAEVHGAVITVKPAVGRLFKGMAA